jgi:hypothetical protein
MAFKFNKNCSTLTKLRIKAGDAGSVEQSLSMHKILGSISQLLKKKKTKEIKNEKNIQASIM